MSTDTSGNLISQARFTPFGEELTWEGSGESPTDFGFTGQRRDSYINLLDYGARWYDARLGRFLSADFIIADPFNPMAFDRFSYVKNNATNRIDPSGNIDIDCLMNGCPGSDDASGNSEGGGLNGIMSLLMPTFTEGINDLLWIVLGVFAETSNGTHPVDAIALKAHALINWRLQNPHLDIIQKIRRATAGIEKAFGGGNPTEKLTNAIACYSNPTACPKNGPNFMVVLEIVEQVYANLLAGDPDPLGGGIFFSDQDDLVRENNGVVVETIPDLPMGAGLQTWLEENFAQMQQWYPDFQYALSQPFINPATGKWTIVVGGNHGCVSDGDCGAPGYVPSKGAE